MSIRYKLIIMFLAIALVPTLFVGAITFKNYKNSIEANHFSQLRNLAAFKAERIETYFAGLKADIEIAQGFYNIKKNLPVLTRLAHDPNNPEFLAAQKTLDEQLQQMQSVTDMSDIMLVNPEGRVVYANRPGHYSKDMSKGYDAEQKAFSEGKDRICLSDVYFDKEEDNRLEILLTAPASDFNGAFIGVIAFEVDMTPVHKLIQDATGLGKTGEVLVGKKSGNEIVYLNPLRHEPNTVMKRINIGEEAGGPIQEAVQGRSGAGQLIDYQGKKVIAAWRYIPSLDWGMVAKIDVKEAFADVTNLRHLIIIILVIIIALSSVMAFSIAQSISEPIKRLSKGAEIIGGGNLDYKIGTNLKDEIGQLSRSFDKMTHDLKTTTASRDELSIEVRERKQAEAALRESEIKYRTVADNTYDWEFWLDPEGRFIYCSPSCKRITGHKPEEFLANPSLRISLVHPDDRPQLEKHLREVEHKQEGFAEAEWRYIRPDGTCCWVAHICQPVYDKSGQFLGIRGSNHDITERKEAEEVLRKSREDLNRAQAVAHTGSWRLDIQRDELTWSEEAYHIFGIPTGTPMTYESFLACVHHEDRKYVNQKWREALRGKGYDIEHRIVVDGQTKWVREKAELESDKDGTLLGGFGTATDITEQKELEDQVKQRTEELARSNRDLEQFAYVASHDLQEPLRAVAGFVGLLRMQLRDSLDAKKLEYMNFATDGVARMQSLINGLLEYSRVGTRDKKPEMTDSKAALGRAIAHLGGGVREFGAKITFDDLPKVCVDAVQLTQLFQNLVGNALKFCNNETPQVHISATRADGVWRFAVTDNGIGIEPQYAERIFQIFQRLHSRDKYPGTGIGLAICKKIVERHGGKIWVESKPGSGSTFYFTIPDKGDI
ncbi:MAG: PAS domain-containing protein [Sedimentisphaerales bacterium]